MRFDLCEAIIVWVKRFSAGVVVLRRAFATRDGIVWLVWLACLSLSSVLFKRSMLILMAF